MAEEIYCTHCGEKIPAGADYCIKCACPVKTGKAFCKNCGEPLKGEQVFCLKCGKSVEAAAAPRIELVQLGSFSQISQRRLAAILFAVLLGSFGAHKFYLGRIGLGTLYFIFCWTGIPFILGIIEGILYLTMSDADFDKKYPVH